MSVETDQPEQDQTELTLDFGFWSMSAILIGFVQFQLFWPILAETDQN